MQPPLSTVPNDTHRAVCIMNCKERWRLEEIAWTCSPDDCHGNNLASLAPSGEIPAQGQQPSRNTALLKRIGAHFQIISSIPPANISCSPIVRLWPGAFHQSILMICFLFSPGQRSWNYIGRSQSRQHTVKELQKAMEVFDSGVLDGKEAR